MSSDRCHLRTLAELGPITVQANGQVLCSAIERAGVRAFPNSRQLVSPYVFRHALASQLKAEGYEPEIIGVCLGHRKRLAIPSFLSAERT